MSRRTRRQLKRLVGIGKGRSGFLYSIASVDCFKPAFVKGMLPVVPSPGWSRWRLPDFGTDVLGEPTLFDPPVCSLRFDAKPVLTRANNQPSSLFRIMDLIRPRARKDMRFYMLLRAGKRAERTINLFEAATGPGMEGHWTVDDVIREVESQLRDKYRSGPVSTATKQAIDQSMPADKETDEDRS
jgi:hypothetical protein